MNPIALVLLLQGIYSLRLRVIGVVVWQKKRLYVHSVTLDTWPPSRPSNSENIAMYITENVTGILTYAMEF